MGLRGPKPQPLKVLQMKGSRRVEARKHEISIPTSTPVCPQWLDEDGQSAWKVLIGELEQLGLLSCLDQNALGRYVKFYQRWLEAEAFLVDHGNTYVAPTGVIHAYPEVGIASQMGQQMYRLEQDFGLTPLSRSRAFSHLQREAVDEFEAFAQRGQKKKA
jgi:P27 family predicted phage terminase small subunit